MAKATATSAPVAGQHGYKGDLASKPAELTTETERSVQPIGPKPKRETPTAALQPARTATGNELLAELIVTGTNPIKMAPARAWLDENPSASAEAMYRFLENAEYPETSQGTLRKAGKWLWGPTWELDAAVLHTPVEEIAKLRGQIASLEGQLAIKNAELANTKFQLLNEQERVNSLTRQVAFLQQGRTAEDLNGAISAGHNALAAAGV